MVGARFLQVVTFWLKFLYAAYPMIFMFGASINMYFSNLVIVAGLFAVFDPNSSASPKKISGCALLLLIPRWIQWSNILPLWIGLYLVDFAYIVLHFSISYNIAKETVNSGKRFHALILDSASAPANIISDLSSTDEPSRNAMWCYVASINRAFGIISAAYALMIALVESSEFANDLGILGQTPLKYYSVSMVVFGLICGFFIEISACYSEYAFESCERRNLRIELAKLNAQETKFEASGGDITEPRQEPESGSKQHKEVVGAAQKSAILDRNAPLDSATASSALPEDSLGNAGVGKSIALPPNSELPQEKSNSGVEAAMCGPSAAGPSSSRFVPGLNLQGTC